MSTNRRVLLSFTSVALLAAGLWLSVAPARDAGPDLAPTAGAIAGAPASAQAWSAEQTGRRNLLLDPYGAPAGRVLEFTVDAHTQSRIANQKTAASGTDGAPAAGLDLRGVASITVLAQRADELAFAFRLDPTSLQATAGAQASALADFRTALAEPALVRMTAHGEVKGYRFPAAWRAEVRNLVRSLVASHRVATPRSASTEWSGEEADATGYATVRNAVTTLSPLAIARTKVAYRAQAKRQPSVAGTGEADFDAAIGWIARSANRDTLTVAVDEVGFVVTTVTDVAFALARTRDEAVEVPADLWTAPWAPAAGSDETSATSRRVLGFGREDLEGVTVARLLTDIAPLASARGAQRKGLIDLRNRLVALLAFEPQAVEELRLRLLDPALGDELASVLLSALGADGSPAAQAILGQIATDPTAKTPRRVLAVQAAFQVQRAGSDLHAALRAMAGDTTVHGEVAGVSLQLLGTYAGAARADASPQRFSELLGMEARASERGLLLHWLDALGNSRQPEIIDPVRRHLAAAEDTTRAAAVGALHGLRTDEATSLLAVTAIEDVAPRVRSTALEVLLGRDDAVARATVERALSTDPSERVRRIAILGVGRQLGRAPDAERLLRLAAARDGDPELRRLAADLLAGRQG